MKSWIGAKDVLELVPVSIREARQIIKDVRYEMTQEGAYLINAKELLAPKNRVLKKLEIAEGN